MSHNTTAKLLALKTGALIKAAEKLGFVIVNGEANLWGNTARVRLYLTHPKSRYDVALNKADGGVFEFTTDFWGSRTSLRRVLANWLSDMVQIAKNCPVKRLPD